jgi:hypothetical protein
MVILSNDGSLEVSTSSKADADGKFTVSAKQLTDDNIRGFINVVFGSEPENSTRLVYDTQNRPKTWFVNGSHIRDVIISVEITITAREQNR